MAESTPISSAATARVMGVVGKHRRLVAAGVGLCAATLVAALAIPVGLPGATAGDGGGPLGGASVAAAPAEDLSAFSGTERWGGLTYAELEAQRRAAAAGADAEAARRDRMGFLGTTAVPGDRVVLLTLPGGEVARVPAGGTLPDGRTVSAADGSRLTLSASPGDEEEIELFPRVIEPGAASPPEENESVLDEDGTVRAPW